MLMEHFFPEAARDTFPTAEKALFKGAVTVGEWKTLQKSIPAVSELCAWWNATAPEGPGRQSLSDRGIER